MGFMDILERYAGQAAGAAPPDTHADFSTVASQAPPDALGSGIADALRGGQAGSFASAIEQLFANSDRQQRTGLLAQLVQAAGPALLSSFAGGALSHLAQPGVPVQPADTDALTPAQAGELASAAHANDPGIVDRVGAFYSQHPTVVKALGAAALAFAMNRMARRA